MSQSLQTQFVKRASNTDPFDWSKFYILWALSKVSNYMIDILSSEPSIAMTLSLWHEGEKITTKVDFAKRVNGGQQSLDDSISVGAYIHVTFDAFVMSNFTTLESRFCNFILQIGEPCFYMLFDLGDRSYAIDDR